MLAEKQRAFAAQFSSGENGGAGTANLSPPGHYDMASSGKLPPPGLTCLTSRCVHGSPSSASHTREGPFMV